MSEIKSTVLRTVQLSQEGYERIVADLDATDIKNLTPLITGLMMDLALKREKAWEEVARIANVNRETEKVRISYVTKEILVMAKGADDER